MPAPIRFYSENELGPKRTLTPEGFLVCHDVPIARTGTLLYAPGEVPIDAGQDGVIGIGRDEADVFHPNAIASFEGKPVTNDHPPLGVKVDPMNWRQLAIGDVHNVHRGDGLYFDNQYLYADLLIKDADAIRDVLDGKREVSAGYDAEYEQLAPGQGRQHDIIGNHVALVDRGRCGPTCSIGDSLPKEFNTMANSKRASFIDRVKAAFYSRDESALVSELAKVDEMMGDIVSDDMPAGMGHINLNFHGMGQPKSGGPESVAGDDMPPGMGGAPAAPMAGPAPMPQPGAPPAAGAADPMAQILQRLETLEQAVMLLAQDEGDDEPEAAPAPPAAPEDQDAGKVGAEDDAAEIEGEQHDWPEAKGGITATAKGLSGDRRRARVGDSSGLAAAFQDMVSRAAVLAPGFKLPAFDAAKGARMTVDAMCNFRRRTLARSWGTSDGREVIGRVYSPTRKGADFSRDAMSCDAATAIFNGAAALAGANNTHDTQNRMAGVMDHGREVSANAPKPVTISDLNAKAKSFWDTQLKGQAVR